MGKGKLGKKPKKGGTKKSPSKKAVKRGAPKLKATAVQAPPCKISSALQVKASDMPVTINLCKDKQGHPADSTVVLVKVEVFIHNTNNSVAGQPTKQTSNSFDLDLKPGVYDINSTVGPGSGAKPGPMSTVFLFEACGNPAKQLCAFTAGGPNCGFTLKVTPDAP